MNGKEYVVVSGLGSLVLSDALNLEISNMNPPALGVASAFVTVEGVRQVIRICNRVGTKYCRLVAGVDHAVTHPEALHEAVDSGWEVRLGSGFSGIFHPKIIVGGRSFRGDGAVDSPSFAYIGSGNLTHAGLNRNVECGLLSWGDKCPEDASVAFADLWRHANKASPSALKKYSQEFAERNRKRRVEDLQALGIYDPTEEEYSSYGQLLHSRKPPLRGAISTSVARAAWASLESFTGEYRFQVEFPRAAGEVLRDMISHHGGNSGAIPVYCIEEGGTRLMQYGYYVQNSMFRLNIPNDVLGVTEARSKHRGVVLLEATRRKSAVIQLRILQVKADIQDVVARSVALGTWGKTSTRLYGWF